MRFRYIGPEASVEVFGAIFHRDEPVAVEGSHAAFKLAHHPEFEPADQEAGATVEAFEQMEAPRRRGRPPKVVMPDADEA